MVRKFFEDSYNKFCVFWVVSVIVVALLVYWLK